MQQKENLLIVIEGNISSGKSTFLNILKNDLSMDVIQEPTEEWKKIGEGNLLDLFYKDTSRWAYTFQSYAFITRIKAYLDHKKKSSHPISVLERSVYCDRYCFEKNCFESGTINALEWQIYKEWFYWLVSNFIPTNWAFLRLSSLQKV